MTKLEILNILILRVNAGWILSDNLSWVSLFLFNPNYQINVNPHYLSIFQPIGVLDDRLSSLSIPLYLLTTLQDTRCPLIRNDKTKFITAKNKNAIY